MPTPDERPDSPDEPSPHGEEVVDPEMVADSDDTDLDGPGVTGPAYDSQADPAREADGAASDDVADPDGLAESQELAGSDDVADSDGLAESQELADGDVARSDDVGDGDEARSDDVGDGDVADSGDPTESDDLAEPDGAADPDDLGESEDVHEDGSAASGTIGAPVGRDPVDATATSRRGVIVVGVVLVVLVAALVGVFVLNSSSDPVYTVYEQSVSRDDLATRLEGLVSEPTVEAARNIEDATSEQRAEVASVVSTLITEDAMRIAATDLDVEITEADVDAQLEEVIASGFGGDRAQFETAVEESGQTTETVRAQFRTALFAEALVADTETAVTDEEVQAFYDENFDLPLVSHILTETEDEAIAARARLDDDEDFAAVAQEASLDTSAAQGGRLGPLEPGQFVPAFEEAALALEPGEISDPVETEFGWHVITIEPAPALDDVREQIATQIEDNRLNEEFVALAERLDTEAEITVDPAFGTWSGLGGGGLVPAGLDVEQEPALPPQPSE